MRKGSMGTMGNDIMMESAPPFFEAPLVKAVRGGGWALGRGAHCARVGTKGWDDT